MGFVLHVKFRFYQVFSGVHVKFKALIFDFFLWRGALLISHKKYIKDGKVLNHLELRSKVLLRPFTELSAWVGFCPTVGCQISTLIFEKKIMERGSL